LSVPTEKPEATVPNTTSVAVSGTLIVSRAFHQVSVLVAQTVEDGVEWIACGRGLSLITSELQTGPGRNC
jgi:hypothetical protein